MVEMPNLANCLCFRLLFLFANRSKAPFVASYSVFFNVMCAALQKFDSLVNDCGVYRFTKMTQPLGEGSYFNYFLKPKICRACAGLATGMSYFWHSSAARAIKAAFDGANVLR